MPVCIVQSGGEHELIEWPVRSNTSDKNFVDSKDFFWVVLLACLFRLPTKRASAIFSSLLKSRAYSLSSNFVFNVTVAIILETITIDEFLFKYFVTYLRFGIRGSFMLGGLT